MKRFLMAFAVAFMVIVITAIGDFAESYVLTGTKWEPGPDSAAINTAANLGTPGGATWSYMAAGHQVPIGDNFHPSGTLSVNYVGMTGLGNVDPLTGQSVSTGGVPIEPWAVDWALNTWAAASNFTNLGMVADGDGGTADNTPAGWNGNNALNANGGNLGDIRIAAYDFLGSILADTYNPGTQTDFGTVSDPYYNIGGDAHFASTNDQNFTWINDPLHSLDPGDPNYPNYVPNAYDFPTNVLHEIGHALGLSHPDESDPVMALYVDRRHALRTLTADDIEGIEAIYAPVPIPSTLILLGTGLIGLAGLRKKFFRK